MNYPVYEELLVQTIRDSIHNYIETYLAKQNQHIITNYTGKALGYQHTLVVLLQLT